MFSFSKIEQIVELIDRINAVLSTYFPKWVVFKYDKKAFFCTENSSNILLFSSEEIEYLFNVFSSSKRNISLYESSKMYRFSLVNEEAPFTFFKAIVKK